MRRIVILTQYFPPETGAPQNRLYELAVRLKRNNWDVTVITAMPNYPKMEIHADYKNKFITSEDMNGIRVLRSWIFVSQSKNIAIRLLNYFSFVFTSLINGWFKAPKADYLLCESPPLFLGISAILIKAFRGYKLIFNVSDLWPETAEKLNLVKNRLLLRVSYALEKFLYNRSVLVTGQTQGICQNIASRFPHVKTYWLPNGVDPQIFSLNKSDQQWRIKNGFKEQDVLMLYAGILGHAQGLEVIINAAEKLQHFSNLYFILLGSGPEKESLIRLKESKSLKNVLFFDAVEKNEMPSVVSSCNAAIVPLKKLEIFKGAIPSKIFENLAMKKPVFLGVDGEARDLFINDGKCGWYFEPENSQALAQAAESFMNNPQLVEEYGENAFNYVLKNFNRDKIANEFMLALNQLNERF